MFFWERVREREREKETEGDIKPTAGSRLWAVSTEPDAELKFTKQWDHDLSQSQMLNQLSHPGVPPFANIKPARTTTSSQLFNMKPVLCWIFDKLCMLNVHKCCARYKFMSRHRKMCPRSHYWWARPRLDPHLMDSNHEVIWCGRGPSWLHCQQSLHIATHSPFNGTHPWCLLKIFFKKQ